MRKPAYLHREDGNAFPFNMEEFVQKVKVSIEKNRMIGGGETVLAAFSGGADSLSLLVALYELQEELGFQLAATHVHHGIRAESADRDLAFCRDFCEDRGISFYFRKVDAPSYAKENGLSLEEAARHLRYQALFEIAEGAGAGKIAVAHHREDQAETLIFQMIRGSGLRGLSAMRPVNGEIIRPLLDLSKQEILAFLNEQGLSWCEDETNEEDKASRAKIRHHVIPALTDVRPDAVTNLVRTAEYLGKLDESFTNAARAWLSENARVEDGSIFLPVAKLPEEEEAQNYILREALALYGCGLKDVTRRHIEDARALFSKQVGKQVMLPGNVLFERGYAALILKKAKEDPAGRKDARTEEDVALPTFSCRIFPNREGLTFPEKEYTKCFDYDKINGPLCMRTRQEGDLFSTRTGTEKKLKDYFIDAKVPREERDRIPLLANGKNILWAVGLRMNENYKVSGSTKWIVEIRIGGKENAG